MSKRTKRRPRKARVAATAAPAAPTPAPAPLPPPPVRVAGDWRAWVLAGLAAIVVFAVYSRTLGHEFVDWDDTGVLTENPFWRGLGAEQIRWMFTTNHYGHYQPITWLTYGLDYELWEMNPTGYHLTNNLLHSINTLLVYFVALILLGSALRSNGGFVRLGAAAAALLFGLHPLRVESVAWATERRDLVSAMFILLTVLAYLRYADPQRRGRAWWFALALLAYVMSMLSKVGGAPLPVVLLVLDWYPLRRLGLWPRQWRDRSTLRIVAEKIPLLLIAVGFSVATIMQQTGRWLIPLEAHGLVARTAQAFYGLVFYIWKTVLPWGLQPLYEMHLPLDPVAVRFVIAFVLVVAAVVAALTLWQRGRPAFLAAGLCYAAMLGPVLGFFQNGPQIVADRYSYLSTLGWLLLAAAGLVWLLRRVAGRPALTAAVGVTTAAVLAGLGTLTWRQSAVWRDTESLWAYLVRADPDSSFANNGYGYVLRTRHRADEAVEYFRTAIRINPGNREAHENLWEALERSNRLDERRAALNDAAGSSQRGIKAKALYLLGNDLMRENRNQEAADRFIESLAAVERYAPAHSNLARVLARVDRTNDAILHYMRAIALDPTLLPARDGLAQTYARQGRYDEAIRELQAALAIDPEYSPSKRRLAALRQVVGDR